MSSIPAINNTPSTPDPIPDSSQGTPATKPNTAFTTQVKLSKEAEARAQEALAALENFGGKAQGASRKKPGATLPGDTSNVAENEANAEAQEAQQDLEEAEALEAQAAATPSDVALDKADLAKAKKLLADAKAAQSKVQQYAQQANAAANKSVESAEQILAQAEQMASSLEKLAGAFSGAMKQQILDQAQKVVSQAKATLASAQQTAAATSQTVSQDASETGSAVSGIQSAVTGTQTAVQTAESYAIDAPTLLQEVESNPENIMFFAMIDMASTTGKSISAYYAGVSEQNQKIAQLNKVLTELDNLEEQASAKGPNGTTSTSGLQTTLAKLGIALGNPANSTQIGDAAQSVNNNISSLSTQSSTAMDELQMLSNNYNTDSQQLSAFLQSIAQTQQGTAHNM